MTGNLQTKTPLLLAGMGLLAVVALIGWLREPAPPAQAYAGADPNLAMQQPLNTSNAAFRQNGFYSSPVYERRVAETHRVETRPQRFASTSAAPRETTVVRKRKFSHSVAIVAGSAGAGAAIGALAGGGKGAAIGALAGGGGGLLYDRLTHKKRVRR